MLLGSICYHKSAYTNLNSTQSSIKLAFCINCKAVYFLLCSEKKSLLIQNMARIKWKIKNNKFFQAELPWTYFFF